MCEYEPLIPSLSSSSRSRSPRAALETDMQRRSRSQTFTHCIGGIAANSSTFTERGDQYLPATVTICLSLSCFSSLFLPVFHTLLSPSFIPSDRLAAFSRQHVCPDRRTVEILQSVFRNVFVTVTKSHIHSVRLKVQLWKLSDLSFYFSSLKTV